jgi:excinuclease ABC subunit C
MDKVRESLKYLPSSPGVYLFKDTAGSILYVGKAKNLKNRVSQYFQKDNDGRPQIPFLLKEIKSLEHIVTDNEIEALFLENTLIKKHKPRYNIKLRDDKNYVYIKIDFETEIPQIYTIRTPDTKNARYFGPYSSALKVRETLNLIRKIFPYCSNKKITSRPCFYYYLHRCPGVCIGTITPEEYRLTITKIGRFLSGHTQETYKELKKGMQEAASNRQFEKAAEIRDQLRSLEVIEERQKAIFAQKVDWDFISYVQTADKSTVNIFVIREGKLIDRKNFILEDTQNKSGSEIICAFMERYYFESEDLPKEIFTQSLPGTLDILNEVFKTKGKKLSVEQPRKGKKRELIELGVQNAKEYFEQWSHGQASELSRTTIALDELQKVLSLPNTPFRIECFDISNIQGTNSVASMVVFENGKPKKSDYRKFKIKIDGQPNDFAMMKEALSRRFSIAHIKEDSENRWMLPDLLVIDGGKGQLGVACEVLKEKGLNIPVIGLAKREEEIFRPGISEPITLPHSDYSLQLLQRLRDEAHRFAITFHKKIRSKEAYKSALDEVPGVGPKTKKLLIQTFGSIENVKRASRDDLARVVGSKLADSLHRSL